MSHTAVKAVLDRSQSKGAVRLVALVYAEAVAQADVDAGRPWIAWPSQRRVAERAVIAERTVRFALAELCAMGEMRRTGELRGRGAVVYDLMPGAPERVGDEARGCLSGKGLPDEDKARESAPRQSAAAIRQPVTAQSGNGLPMNQKEPEPEPEGACSSSEIKGKGDGGDSWERFLSGKSACGDFEPTDLAASMQERVRGAAA